jgi:hypothetical protein
MSTTLQGKQMFNGEELLFLNRVAFLLLSEHGSHLKFKTFIDTLRILQDGTFLQKIDLVCEMIKEGRKSQQLVQVDHVVNFFLASMPQETDHATTA